MPRTPEHIALTHQLAADLRSQGRPIWAEKVLLGDIWRNEDLTFEERRDAIVARLKTSRWFKNADEDESWGVHEIIAYHLAEAEDADRFDECWDELYDHADCDRVWIDLHQSGQS